MPKGDGPRRVWGVDMAVLPAVGTALLPKLACPACWPAYAGVLGSLGLGFLLKTAWLLPLTAAFLALALGSLALRSRLRGYRPLALGLLASVAVMAGKFWWSSDPVMYAGIGLLVAASLWSSRPSRGCPSCDR